jgi:hypothetical protein
VTFQPWEAAAAAGDVGTTTSQVSDKWTVAFSAALATGRPGSPLISSSMSPIPILPVSRADLSVARIRSFPKVAALVAGKPVTERVQLEIFT